MPRTPLARLARVSPLARFIRPARSDPAAGRAGLAARALPRLLVPRVLACGLVIGTLSCNAPGPAGPTTGPATAATAPVPALARTDAPLTVRWADASPLKSLRLPSEEVNLAYRIVPPALPRAMYFGTLTPYAIETATAGRGTGGRGGPASAAIGDEPGQRVILAARTLRDYQALPLALATVHNPTWSYAASGPGPREAWAVVESADEEDLGPDLALVHSTDGGESWSVVVLHKDAPAAEFAALSLGPDGRGRLTLYLDPASAPSGASAGYYHYATADGGQTWQAATHEADATRPAEDVPDEDQPKRGSVVARATP